MCPPLLVVVAGLALFGCGREPAERGSSDLRASEAPALDEGVRPDPALPSAGPSWVAVVLPAGAVDVAPQMQGELLAVHVRPGDPVEAGDPIATLDDRDAHEALVMAKAKLASLESACATADVDLAEAEQHLDTERTLAAKGASSPSTVEAAEFAVKRATAERAQAKAARAEQRAVVEQRRRHLAQTSIIAPFSGSIVHRYRDVGAAVGPAMPVVRLIGAGPPRVRFAVPPRDASRLTPDTPLVVQVETLAMPLDARVRQVAAQIDRASHLTFVEADLVGADAMSDALRPGLPARVSPRR